MYTRLPNRLGLHLIEYEKFNHVDFLYSYNVTEMVYQSVINLISTAEYVDWVPTYDNTTSSRSVSDYTQCRDTEFRERTARKKSNGFWSKITSFLKTKPENLEVYPLAKVQEDNYYEEHAKNRNMFVQAWNETYNFK